MHRGFFEYRIRALGGGDAQVCHGFILAVSPFVMLRVDPPRIADDIAARIAARRRIAGIT